MDTNHFLFVINVPTTLDSQDSYCNVNSVFLEKQSIELHIKVPQYINAYLCEQKRMDEKKLQKIGWQVGDNDSDRSVGTIRRGRI